MKFRIKYFKVNLKLILLSLVEKAQENFDIDQAKELEKKMRTKDFSLEDFMKMQQQMKAMGSIDQILGMLPIPGISKNDREQIAHAGEGQLKKIEAMVSSMTIKERQKPEILNANRRRRIATGSGVQVADLNRFLKEFEKMKIMMKKMADVAKTGKMPFGMKNPQAMMKNMQNKGGNYPRF